MTVQTENPDEDQDMTQSEDQGDPTIRLSAMHSAFRQALSESYGTAAPADVTLGSAPLESVVSASVERLRVADDRHVRYVLKGEIGRGGMGAVLKVFDADLRRNLAMKIVLGRDARSGEDSTAIEPDQLLRFLEEAQVTGQLDHPGVVPVHELGVDADGRVYFTMLLVKGQELSKVFEKVHAGDPDWNRTRALGLLLKVCEAMSYAHDKGVVHRDLKPANIMVGRHGEVYVMDWGLARVAGREDSHDLRLRNEGASLSVLHTDRHDAAREGLDSPLLTMDGSVVGTPFYMPPEQAAGRLAEIGPHSDVYALGALLYHLLAGRMPYHTPGDHVSPRMVLARVLNGPPHPLAEVAPDIPPELEAICAKAMARDASARYRDMGELAEDLRAFLEHRVVHAYKTGAIVEFKSWVERNRTLAMTAAAMVVLTVGGSTTAAVVLGAKNEEIRHARDTALSATELAAAAARNEAQLRSEADEAREASEIARAASETVTKFLVTQFESLQPASTRGRPVQVSELLDRAVLALDGELVESPLEATRLREVLGNAYQSLGRYESAEPLLLRAWRDRDRLLGSDNTDTLTAVDNLARLYHNQGRLRKTEPLYVQTLEKRRALHGEKHPDTLRSMNNLAELRRAQGRFDDAERLYLETLEKRREVLGEDSPSTLATLNNLALLYYARGRYNEAEPLYLETLEKLRAVHGENHPQTLTTMSNLALLFGGQGRAREAEPLYQRVIEKAREVLGPEHPQTLAAMTNLAAFYRGQGRLEESEELGSEALELMRAALGDDHLGTLSAMTNLGLVYLLQGRHPDAEELLVLAFEKRRTLLGETHPDTRDSIERVRNLYQLWHTDLRQRLGENHAETLDTLRLRAMTLVQQERLGRAETLFVDCLDRRLEAHGELHPDTLESFHDLAALHAQRGNKAQAEALFRECLNGRREILGADHAATLATVEALAELSTGDSR